ncbi:ATP-NAD kinase-like domain-containing protein, partial [Lasiosphaeria ovina]
MPSSSVIPLHLRQRSSSKTECIVHQFLEGQRWARHPSVASAAAAASAQHESYNRHADDDSSIAVHREGSRPRSPSPAGDISSEWGLDDVPDLKGAGAASAVSAATAAGSNSGGQKSLRCDILDGDSSETSNGGPGGGIGQLDEREWKAQIVKTTSEIDLSASTAAAAAAAGGGGSPAQEVQSRLLTKRQLSDMAWGVRELSRRLGSVRLRFRVKSIFILTKIHDRDLVHKARQLTRWLLDRDRDVRYIVYVERDLKDNKLFDAAGLVDEVRRDFAAAHDDGEASDGASAADVARRLRYWDEGMCRARPHTFDFVITLGGDGTVLYASWLFQRIVPPVLSFALGSLGFLTKFDFEDHQHILTGAFTEGVSVSLRLRFEGTVMRSQRRRKKRQQHPNLLTDGGEKEETDDDDDDDNTELERQRDLVEELIGEEKEDEHTHRPDGTFEVLNEIVVDRGPNP